MASQSFRKVMGLELEEKILNAAVLVAIIGVFLPWIGGEKLGGATVSYSGFGFYTTVIGLSVFLLQVFVLLITVVPLTGGPVFIRKRYREIVRLCATAEAVILILAALSVLIKVTLDFARMEIRFGIYVTLIGSLVALFEAFLRFQEQRKGYVQEIFHHPEEERKIVDKGEFFEAPPPPPPPPPPAPEEHRMYR